MNADRIDAAARALQSNATRRSGLGAALAAAAAALLGGAAGAEDDAARRGKGRVEGPCGDGSATANRCQKNSDCCTDICRQRPGTAGRCRCLSRGDSCRNARNCCGDLTCRQGACVPSRCGPETCPRGCCQDGVCIEETSPSACGTGGAACRVCPESLPFCTGGTCDVGPWKTQSTIGSGPGTARDQFYLPLGATLSPDGLTLFVSDSENFRVDVWSRASARSPWTVGAPIGNGEGTAIDQFREPGGQALEANGLTLYVSDSSNNRVVVWKRASLSSTWQAQTPIGNGLGDANDQLRGTLDVALSPNQLEMYISDRYGDRIALWTRTTLDGAWQAQTPIGNGSGSADDQFDTPAGLVLSSNGLELFVASRAADLIMHWTRASVGAPWQAQSSIGDGTGAAIGQLEYPNFPALSPDDLTLYVTDTSNHRVAVWTRASVGAQWVARPPIGSGPGMAINQFARPYGLALAATGNAMFVVDRDNNRVVAWKKV